MEEADGKSRTGPHAAAGRQVAVVMQFEAAVEMEIIQGRAHDRMADIIHPVAGLDIAIDDADAMFKERRQMATSEIAVFVDGDREDGAAVGLIPSGVVGAAAEEGDAVGRSADNHP